MIVYKSNLDMSTTENALLSLTYSGWTVPAIGVARKSQRAILRRRVIFFSHHIQFVVIISLDSGANSFIHFLFFFFYSNLNFIANNIREEQ